MTAIQKALKQTWRLLTPPPDLTVSEWANRFRYLSKESSAQANKYRTASAPYQKEPMNTANDEAVQTVCLMWAAQTGKTEAINNVVGYFIDSDPAPILVVQPTIEFAESWSKERLVPMLRDCRCFVGKIRDAKSRDSGNTILHKSFVGGNIAIVGANAPSGLAGRPRRVVLLDEVDRFPASAGTEGDPCALAIRRTESFWNSVIYLTSTPTVKGASRIEAEFIQTDQQRWYCPCPECGTFQVWQWRQVRWNKAEDGTPLPETAWLECDHCHAHLDDSQRMASVKAGEWRATAPFTGKRGYHLSGICSPFKAKRGFKNRLHQMAAQFLEAKAGGEMTLRSWTNTFLAETWEDEGAKLDQGELVSRVEPYTPETLPPAVVLVTAAVDVQADRLEVETVGIGVDSESWGIETAQIFGDTEQDTVWSDLSEFLSKTYKRTDGIGLPISATAIDVRHKQGQVRRWAREGGLARCYMVYGVGSSQPLLVTTRWNKSASVRTYAVNGHVAKDALFARLRIKEHGPRYCHFPRGFGYTDEWFAQLTAETLRTKYVKGHPVQSYEKIRARNEALDIRVYWLACLDILRPNLTAIARHLTPEPEQPQPAKEYVLKPHTPPAPAKAQPRLFRPQRTGFVNRWKR